MSRIENTKANTEPTVAQAGTKLQEEYVAQTPNAYGITVDHNPNYSSDEVWRQTVRGFGGRPTVYP